MIQRHMRGLHAALVFALLLTACTDTDKDNAMTDTKTHEHTNHLINENSPYLLSHAHNPVDWYPWGEEALNKAKAEDKPIFLSIGYAACHWCHVMEHESFENDTIAAILNKHFVAIKVDREQRPDIDHIYMTFTQAMTGRGGWPMSVFLTPELKPFFAGTYFPPEDRQGMPGFQRVLSEIAAAYTENKEQLINSADDMFAQINEAVSRRAEPTLLNGNMLAQGAKKLMENFDHQFGGFGGAPKFPHATELNLFLRYYKKSGDLSYLHAAEQALQGMARGGIYDHLGGGFARYSVDARWLVPHFEKMLYDNGLLVTTYANAYRITENESYLETIKGTLDWMLTEMTADNGGFYSALDADSEGEEGKFYVWTPEEITNTLKSGAQLFMDYYNVTAEGNFEGKNILNIDSSSERLRQEYKSDNLDARLKPLRAELLKARNKRVRPLTDDKILTSWNGLALSALAHGYQLSRHERYLKAARANAQFVKDELWRDGKLTHSYREGKHSEGEFLEDYAYYVRGLIDLYESDPGEDNSQWLEFAVTLSERALDQFIEDSEFYLRPAGQTDLIYRPRDEFDSALPSEGSFMITNLFRLGRLTGRDMFTTAAENSLRAISGSLERAPQAMVSALMALDFHTADKLELVIVGHGEARQAILDLAHKTYLPNRVIAISVDGEEPWPLFEGRKVDGGGVKAYLCRNSVCGRPAETVDQLREQLQAL